MAELLHIADIFLKANPHYDFVQANCQSFVYWLAGALPKCVDPNFDPSFAGHEFWKILDDIQRYLTAGAETSDNSLKQSIDNVVQYLKYAAFMAAGMMIMCYKQIKEGVTWFITKMPQDALTWIVQGLCGLLEKMRPWVIAVAGTSTAAWNALSSPLGAKILAGVGIVAVVCGAVWLAYEGGRRFWRWWKEHGK